MCNLRDSLFLPLYIKGGKNVQRRLPSSPLGVFERVELAAAALGDCSSRLLPPFISGLLCHFVSSLHVYHVDFTAGKRFYGTSYGAGLSLFTRVGFKKRRTARFVFLPPFMAA